LGANDRIAQDFSTLDFPQEKLIVFYKDFFNSAIVNDFINPLVTPSRHQPGFP
jgi:hypothetical protein